MISILIPAYNEAGNIQELVERTDRAFDALGVPGELIFVDDGSTDGKGDLVIGLQDA
jgi:dolichol-phosphate mannosyltransferase